MSDVEKYTYGCFFKVSYFVWTDVLLFLLDCRLAIRQDTRERAALSTSPKRGTGLDSCFIELKCEKLENPAFVV